MDEAASRFWTINGDFLGLQPTGVARYAREVTAALDGLVAEGHPLTRGLDLRIVAPKPAREPFALASIPVTIVPEFDKPRLPQVWNQLQLPFHVKGGLISFANLGPVAVRRQIICIHDLHTRLAPKSYGRGFRLAHDLLLPLLGRRSLYVATVSRFSRDHIVQFGVADASKVIVTFNGHEHALRWDAEASGFVRPGKRPYVLALGRPQEYKNNELLWRLAAPLETMGLDLYVAGDLGSSGLDPTERARFTNVHFLGRISDDAFAAALKDAVCFLFPSRLEGFGLPCVEAMALGCPIVVSNVACFPEICGDAALSAGPDDDAGWLDAICRLRGDNALREEMIARGRQRVALYSWRKIAEDYLGMMAMADGLVPAVAMPAGLPVTVHAQE